jgi:hypothetical protein
MSSEDFQYYVTVWGIITVVYIFNGLCGFLCRNRLKEYTT